MFGGLLRAKRKRPDGASSKRFLRRCFRSGESLSVTVWLPGGREAFAPASDTAKQTFRLRAYARLLTPPGLALRENGGAS